jgi:hypothetical protein
MEWLTTNYIDEQADVSDLAAIKVSIEHWKQIIKATKKEIASQDLAQLIYFSHCGICSRFFDNCAMRDRGCDKCPLSLRFGMCDDGTVENVWCHLEMIFNSVFKNGCGNFTMSDFKKHARMLLTQLEIIKSDFEMMVELHGMYEVETYRVFDKKS